MRHINLCFDISMDMVRTYNFFMIERRRFPRWENAGFVFGLCLLVGLCLLWLSGRINFIPGIIFLFSLCSIGFISIGYSSIHRKKIGADIIENAFDQVDHPFIVLDAGNKIIDLNPAAKKILDPSRTRFQGLPVQGILQNISLELLDFNDGNIHEFEYESNGRWFHIRGFGIHDHNEHGDIKKLVIEEISEQKQKDGKIFDLEVENRRINNEKEQFLQSISMFSGLKNPNTVFYFLAQKILVYLSPTSIFIFSDDISDPSKKTLLAEAFGENVLQDEKKLDTSFLLSDQGDVSMAGDYLKKFFILHDTDEGLPEHRKKIFITSLCKTLLLIPVRCGHHSDIYLEIRDNRVERGFTYSQISFCQGLALLACLTNDNLVILKKLGSVIEERTLVEERSQYDTYHDLVTGLPNRAQLLDRLNQELLNYKRDQKNLYAILLLDLDKFKIINDSLGHKAGDQLLSIVGQRIIESVREVDTVARIGGDEFAVLLVDIKDIGDAIFTAERIQKNLTKGFIIGSHEVYTSASIGITMGRVTYDNPVDILRDADASMYCAKDFGGGCYSIYDEEMLDQARNLLKSISDLRKAIKNQEFEVYYQPIISFSSNRPICFEALVRWNHPERGLVNPNDFIPVAEEHGMIGAIGEFVLKAACKQLKTWQDEFPQEPPLAVSVNISARQLEVNLISLVREVVEENQPAPGSLILEITESSIIRETESALMILTQLKSLGVKIYLDDFGVGYSSLNILHKFPIDNIKLDRLFVARLTEDQKDIEIVRTIVELGIQLDKVVVAEGIESLGQQQLLKQLNCNFGQGFYFSKPVKSYKIGNMLTNAEVFT
jgi:diguanylate cyclase (GGDEF)-like protein